MEAIKLDIVLNSEAAREALDQYEIALLKMGKTASEAAKEVEKFEKSFTQTTAKKQAEKALNDLVKKTQEAGEAAQEAGKKAEKQATATDALIGAVKRYAAPAAVGAAILKTIEWADNIATMAERMHLSTTQAQQLDRMAAKNGATFGQMASLIQAAEQRLASHNAKAEEAVKILGLVPEKLLAMDPLERLRAIAKGLADLEDPALRSKLEVDLLGQKADAAAGALNALASGADLAEQALGEDFVVAGKKANDVLADIKNRALDAVRAIVLVVPAILEQARKLDEARAKSGAGPSGAVLGSGQGPFFDVLSAQYQAELAKGNLPGLPGGPGAPFMPSGLPVPGSPMEGAAGQSWSFLNRFFGGGRGAKTAAPVVPYTANQWAGMNAVYGNMMNPLGGIPGFPGWAASPLASSMSASLMGLGFDRNSRMVPFAGTVPMHAPGADGGSLWSRLSGGKLGAGLGMGMGLLSNLIPGLSRTGSSIGATAGSLFGPLGSGIGSLAGGLLGKLFGGNSEKNARNAEIGEVFKQFSTKEFVDLQKEADRLGVSMSKALSAKTMKDFGAAVDEVRGKVEQLTALEDEIAALKDAATVDFDKMNAIVNEFGLDIAKLGPAFQQAAMDKEAKKIIDAFAVMEKGGADVNGVLDGMADEISKVVLDSIKFGTTIPENMRPWIEKLKESGKLVDENGEKIVDTSKLKYGEPMASEMDKVVRKLDELIKKLGELTGKFRDATSAAGDLGSVDYNQPPDGGQVNVSKGGIIRGKGNVLYFTRGGFVPHGTDTVPAMLTPGEMVIARDTVKRMAGGRGGATVVNHFHIAGYLDSPKVQRQLVALVAEGIDADTRMQRVG